jgi:ferredoxin
MSAPPRFAVIGTGAAALGVLDALLSRPGAAEISVFDIGDIPEPEPDPGSDPVAFHNALYDDLRASGLKGFPPPKTHFGARLPLHPGAATLVRSRSFGGLTNFWGATILPFTGVELARWPIGPAALAPHYARIAQITGISGQSDALDGYFGAAHINRPPIAVTPTLARIATRVGDRPAGRYRILAGANRCAIETRPGQDRACTACGECLAGCYRGAIYSARQTMADLLADPRVTYRRGAVDRIDPTARAVHVETGQRVGGFSRIFLAAGCLGTTEILMRSAGLAASGPLLTNSVHVFPILNFARGDGGQRGHLALANLILACLPEGHDAPMAQAQIYANPDYLWRPQMPPALWRALRGAVAASRARLFWGRLFVHSDQSQRYAVQLSNSRLEIAEQNPPDRAEPARVLKSLQSALAGGGTCVLTRPTVLQKSSVHYGGTFAYGNTVLSMPASGEVFDGVHVCDSTVFPEMPAVSPTFTIMANARRTAMEALDA